MLFSGLYPVEYRDFFIGDQFNSLFYSVGNIALFFCLYRWNWATNKASQCTSAHSRLYGFFTALPGIWRFFQCLRRYLDSRHPFPHLFNAGKYSATIFMYVMLSCWRVNGEVKYRALFAIFATVNSIYGGTYTPSQWSDIAIYDIFLDWSLLQPHAKHPFLREHLGYNQPWVLSILPANLICRCIILQ